MSVKWSDVSQFQPVVNDAYPHPVFAFRANDGTYRDPHFPANHAWAKSAVDRGKLAFFIVYAVYEPDGGNWVSTLMSMVGTPHPLMVVMIDVESWSGRIKGDHSADINAGRARLAQWLGNSNRVIGYGNRGDLNNLWPNKGDAQVVVAAYGSNPSYPRKIAHQYTDAEQCAPFGAVDMNSADDHDVPSLMGALGLTPDPTGGGSQPFTPPPNHWENDMIAFAYAGWQFLIGDGRIKNAQDDQANVWQAAAGNSNPIWQAPQAQLAEFLWNAGFAAADASFVGYDEITGAEYKSGDAWSFLQLLGGGRGAISAERQQARTASSSLSDADRAAIVQSLVAAVPPVDVEAIATAVRANFAANPLTAAPFELK